MDHHHRQGYPAALPSPLRPSWQVQLFTALVLISAAGLSFLSIATPFKATPRPEDRKLSPSGDRMLMVQLSEADQSWRPRAQLLPGGGTRYTYRRRSGEPPLSIEQIRLLMRYPPSFEQEQQAISELLMEIRRRGVLIVFGPPRKQGAAGEWEPRSAILRIRPDVVSKGSEEFAKVLNHEAIHMAQSCSNGGLRSRPRPLGLPTKLTPGVDRFLGSPVYANISPLERRMELEAYSNQAQLQLGLALIRSNCRQV